MEDILAASARISAQETVLGQKLFPALSSYDSQLANHLWS